MPQRLIGKEASDELMNNSAKDARIRILNDRTVQNGDYVLYWMQSSVRTEYNFALLHAKEMAVSKDIPLIVYFGIDTEYPESNQRHLLFMLQGLKETVKKLNEDNITVILKLTSPETGAIEAGKNASAVFTDCGYLRHQKEWRQKAAVNLKCPLIQAESDVVVPVFEASVKEEWSAGTLRKKINSRLPFYLREHQPVNPEIKKYRKEIPKGYFEDFDIDFILSLPKVKRDVKPSPYFIGGYTNAKETLSLFIRDKLNRYSGEANHPEKSIQSDMSPYLHFGHISPLEIAVDVISSGYPDPGDFLEQLIVRRELAVNFVEYNPYYDSFKGLPAWCIKTLNEHMYDKKEFIYTFDELESGYTHDKYWNAAQNEMKIKGKMHGYMRMYWGKKILEWSESPKEAYKTALYLNNKYSLDGRDPNSYAGIAWCFGKHDRAWGERAVFGKVRYMNEKGLKRKFEIEKYVKYANNL